MERNSGRNIYPALTDPEIRMLCRGLFRPPFLTGIRFQWLSMDKFFYCIGTQSDSRPAEFQDVEENQGGFGFLVEIRIRES